MTAVEKRLHDLFEELVPVEGKADTVAGEIVRAANRIAYRNYNDGDHIGVGYGKETCNPAARFLMAYAGAEVRKTISDMWGMESEGLYDVALQVLELQVVSYLDANPELRERPNTEDLWEYRIPSEDRDDTDDDEDDGWW